MQRQELGGQQLPLFLVIVAGLVLRAAYLFEPVGGAHAFRQVHILNDIMSLKLRSTGIDLMPLERFDHTWRPGLRLFDVPVFQVIATGISDGLDVEPLRAARLLQLLVYVGSAIALWAFSRRAAATPSQATMVVLVYSLLPLTIQFHVAPIPDSLVVALGLASWCYLRGLSSSRGEWYLGLACAGVATLIKPAAYFPFAAGLVFFWCYSDRSGVLGLRGLMFGATCGLSALAYAGLSASFNDAASLANELPWYFGTLTQRLSWDPWWRILRRFWFTAFGPYVGSLFAVVGIWALSRGLALAKTAAKRKGESAVLAFGLGCVFATLVFFNVHVQHDYYQLPYAPVFAHFAVLGGSTVGHWLRTVGVPMPATGRGWALLAVPATVAWLLYSVRTPLLDYHSEDLYTSLGKSVEAGTPASAFVFYVANFAWKDPDIRYLFFAQRHGYYARREAFSDQLIANVRREVPRASGELFAFCAADKDLPAVRCAPWIRATLKHWQAEVAAEDKLGVVFRLRPLAGALLSDGGGAAGHPASPSVAR